MRKKICIIIMIILCFNIFAINTYAARPEDTGHEGTGEESGGSGGSSSSGGTGGSQLYDPITNPYVYEPDINLQSNNTKFSDIGGKFLGIIRFIGTIISVITLLTLGIRYMMGSASQKALYKETMVPYLIGAIMLFAIPNLIGITYDLVTENIKFR